MIGREFDFDMLRSTSDLPAAQILGRLDEAQTARVVSEVPDVLGRFRFTHVLIREPIYDGLLMSRRISLHHRIGTALEEGNRVGPE